MTSTTIAAAARSQASRHVGDIGDRVRIEGVIRQIIGTGKALYILHDKQGNEFAVRWAPQQAAAKSVRALVCIEATVTGHTEFRGVKRTEISSGKSFVVDDNHAFLATTPAAP